MDRVLNLLTLNTVRFHQLSLRNRVVLSQLPLCATVLFLLAVSALFHPLLLADRLFMTGVILTGFLLVLCFATPWSRLPFPSFLIIPLLDFVPIGLIREGADNTLVGLGLLTVFPVIWLTASGLFRRTAIVLSFAATLAMVWVPVFASGSPIAPQDLSSPLLLPFMALAIANTVSVMTRSMMEQQALVESQGERLEALLQASGRRERLLNTIVNAVDVGVLAVDEEGRDILQNRKQDKLQQAALPVGKPAALETEWLVFNPDGVTPVPPERRPRARAVNGETFSDQLVWVGDSAGRRVLSTSARPLKDAEGIREGAVVTYNDVTELVTANNAKDDFVANVTHELRTPLTSILGYVELLSMTDGVAPHVEDGLNVIGRNSDRLLSLVDSLLTAVAPASGIQPTRADLAGTIKESVAANRPRTQEAGIAVNVDVPEHLPATFDPGRISQVLDNLLSNAVKFSPDGGSITVAAALSDGLVVCEVADEGIGMNAEEAKEIFTRFFRSSAARKAAIPGIGIGLAIAKQIVEDHGGTITCRTSPGKGTSMVFTLPADGAVD